MTVIKPTLKETQANPEFKTCKAIVVRYTHVQTGMHRNFCDTVNSKEFIDSEEQAKKLDGKLVDIISMHYITVGKSKVRVYLCSSPVLNKKFFIPHGGLTPA